MGIKSNYTKFLRNTAGDDIYEECHVSRFAFKKVSIDTSLYLYKFKASLGDDRWINGFLNLIKCFRKNNVHCVFIFDGKSPKEKKDEQLARIDSKRKLKESIDTIQSDIDDYNATGIISDELAKFAGKVPFNIENVMEKLYKKSDQIINIRSSDFVILKQLFEAMSIPYYTAPTEAEKMCSKLCIDGHVSAVLSEDTDVIAYQTPLTIIKINTYTNTCFVIDNSKLIKKLNLTRQQFLDHCIMCGTDFNTNIQGIGANKAYKLIIEHKSIEEIGKNTSTDISVLNYETVRKIFNVFEDYDITNVPYPGKPDFDLVKQILHKNDIRSNIFQLENSYFNRNIEFI